MKKLLLFITAFTLVMAAPAQAYTVKHGDTVGRLARKNGTTISEIARLNNLKNVNRIYVGQELELGTPLGITLPTVVATYEDSLASRLASTGATTFTLIRGTDRQDRALNGRYGMVIDEGTASEEFFVATCVSTACTIVTRGLDLQDGKTNVTALQSEHRRGATVKITNFPQLAYLTRILNGQESVPNALYYETGVSFTSSTQLVSKSYADGLTFSGAPDMSLTQKGIAEKATGLEAASSSPSGSGHTTAPLAITTDITTTTPYTTGNFVPVTKNNGKLDANLIDQTSNYIWSGLHTFSATTTMTTSTMTSSTINNINGTNLLGTPITSIVQGKLNSQKLWATTTDYGGDLTSLAQIPLIATTTIAGGTLGTNNRIHVKMNASAVVLNYVGASPSNTITLRVKYGGSVIGSATIVNRNTVNEVDTFTGDFDFYITNANSASSQEVTIIGTIYESGVAAPLIYHTSGVSTGSVNSAVDQELVISAQVGGTSGSPIMTVSDSHAEVIR